MNTTQNNNIAKKVKHNNLYNRQNILNLKIIMVNLTCKDGKLVNIDESVAWKTKAKRTDPNAAS